MVSMHFKQDIIFVKFFGDMDSTKRSYSTTKGNIRKYKSDKSSKELSKSPQTSRQKSLDTPELDPIQVQFPIIKQVDVSKVLPRYTLVLSRNEDGVGMDDLDEIEQDFERLLSTCTVRQSLLKSEIDNAERIEERKEKKVKPHEKTSIVAQQTIKRKRIEEKSKFKDSRNLARVLKTKINPVTTFFNDSPRYEVPGTLMPKHDVSEQFSLSVDSYCQDITKDHVFFFDELSKECSQDIDIKIPEVAEQHHEVEKNGVHSSIADTHPNPITQRLLDALAEEKTMIQTPSIPDGTKGEEYIIQSNNSMKNGMCFDSRLCKELIEQGILDVEDVTKLTELKKLRKNVWKQEAKL